MQIVAAKPRNADQLAVLEIVTSSSALWRHSLRGGANEEPDEGPMAA